MVFKQAESILSMWLSIEQRQGQISLRGSLVWFSQGQIGIGVASGWLVRSVPKFLLVFFCLFFLMCVGGRRGVVVVEGLLLSFMLQLPSNALFFISNLLYFKFMQMLLIGRQYYYLEQLIQTRKSHSRLIQGMSSFQIQAQVWNTPEYHILTFLQSYFYKYKYPPFFTLFFGQEWCFVLGAVGAYYLVWEQ